MARSDRVDGVSKRDDSEQLIASYRLGRLRAIWLGAVSVVLFFFVASLLARFAVPTAGVGATAVSIRPPMGLDRLVWILAGVLVLTVVIVVHEFLHGICIARHGGRASFGFGSNRLGGWNRLDSSNRTGGSKHTDNSEYIGDSKDSGSSNRISVPFVYASSDRAVSRNQALEILLVPAIGMTIGGIVLLYFVRSPLLVLAVAANLAGSTVDCWLATRLMGYSSAVRIGGLPDDSGRGLGVYGDGSVESRVDRGRLWTGLAVFISGTIGTAVVIGMAILAMLFGSLWIGSGTLTLADPTRTWLLLSQHRLPDGVGVELVVGHGCFTVLSATGGITWLGTTTVRRRWR